MSRASGTSTFRNHLKTTHHAQWIGLLAKAQSEEAVKEKHLKSFFRPAAKLSEKDRAKIDEACVLFLVGSKTAFNVLRNQQFKAFLKILNPSYQILSQHKLKDYLTSMSADVDAQVAKELRAAVAVSFTMDG